MDENLSLKQRWHVLTDNQKASVAGIAITVTCSIIIFVIAYWADIYSDLATKKQAETIQKQAITVIEKELKGDEQAFYKTKMDKHCAYSLEPVLSAIEANKTTQKIEATATIACIDKLVGKAKTADEHENRVSMLKPIRSKAQEKL